MRTTEHSDMMYSARWDSWHEWLDYCIDSPNDLGNPSRATSTNGNKWWAGKEWHGTENLADAVNLAENGWNEGAAQVAKMSRVVTDKVTSLIERPVFNYDVEGQSLDIGAFMSGEPECFLRQSTETVEGFGTQHLTLCMDVFASAAISGPTLIKRGMLITSLVECLEFAGRRVELWFGCSSKLNSNSKCFELYAKIKNSEQPIDISRVVFALAHPAAMRRLWFSAIEQIPVYNSWNVIGAHFGRPNPARTISSDLNVAGLCSEIDVSGADAVEIITKQLRDCGIVLHQTD